MESRLAQRDLEARELKHRVANNLHLTATFLTLQERRLEPGEARNALAAAGSRITAIARFHRHLAANRGRPALDFGQFLEALAPDIGAGSGLRCHVETESLEVATERAMHLALIINELAINAGKHAYGGAGGALHIRCRREGRNGLVLSVADDGPGLPHGFDWAKGGLGTSILSSIAAQLGATLTAETRVEGGARFVIRASLWNRPAV